MWSLSLTAAVAATSVLITMDKRLCVSCAVDSAACGLSPPGSSVGGILQARTLAWDAMPSSRRASRPRDQTQVSNVSCLGKWVLYH